MQKLKIFLKTIKPIIVAIVLLVLFRLISFVFLPSEDNSADRINFLTVYYILCSALIIFIVNFLVIRLLDLFIAWNRFPILRFFVQLISGTVFSLGILNCVYHIVKHEFTDAPPDADQIILMNIFGSGIIIPIILFFFGFKFLQAWRKSELESEQLQKENTRSQLLTLRNHLDPHFLFNNLNILSSLMDRDIELSKSYLDKFAEVYRQILKTEYSDLTTLDDEMQLIESYIYLLKIRFQDQVFFNVKINDKAKLNGIPPLSVQMLVENAIKHNMSSKEKPIRIDIYEEDNELVVKNNIQKKKYLPREREATGIINIKSRYAFFTEREVRVFETDHVFAVHLPLIEIEYV